MEYRHSEVLVDTDWVKENLNRPGVRLAEVDVNTQQYDAGHIPGSAAFNWQTQLQDPVKRDIISREDFERLVGGAGISPEDTVVLYGDNNNWFAAYAFWLFKLYGHRDVRIMNGGRQKWLNEADKPLTAEPTKVEPVPYRVRKVEESFRAYLRDIQDAFRRPNRFNLVDVRSPDEFHGKIIAPPGTNETAQRGGHIPGAKNIPWSMAVREDGTFKIPEELKEIYLAQQGLDPGRVTIAYCRIGERSSHTWFVLKYLLGLDNVRNYDGSWTEYGNLVGVPIEK
jgi:thiosulfate/3-mercaptopyruvate sulfurtransferase